MPCTGECTNGHNIIYCLHLANQTGNDENGLGMRAVGKTWFPCDKGSHNLGYSWEIVRARWKKLRLIQESARVWNVLVIVDLEVNETVRTVKIKQSGTGNLSSWIRFSFMKARFHPTAESLRREEALEYNNQGHKKYLKVDFDDAIADYTKAIELDPGLAVAYFNRGTVHYRLGSFDLALKDLKKSVDLEPTNDYFAEGLNECLKMCH